MGRVQPPQARQCPYTRRLPGVPQPARYWALIPNITESVLKLYIAYKAETNFVDLIPQAKRLLLTLNLPFADIKRPERHL